MKEILECIFFENKLTEKELKQKIKAGYSTIPLFTELAKLNNKTLFEHMNQYGKLRNWTLESLIKARAVNLEEQNEEKLTLVQLFIKTNNLAQLRMLLIHGARLKKEDASLATEEIMTNFLNYGPGRDEISILTFCSKKHRDANYLKYVRALILDEADTTDNSSTSAENMSNDSLSDRDQEKLDQLRTRTLHHYNKNPEKYLSNHPLCLVASRGVHFSPKYYEQNTIQKTIKTRRSSHATYSQSTLFDAGYTADDEVTEQNNQIILRHKKNLQFIARLKEEKDHKEKKIGSHNPPVLRNKIVFDSLYYRFMQVYINSYKTLFHLGAIKSDFNFDTQHNPLISASWNMAKAAMYSSGFRFEWKTRDLRRDPHYRRFTGKPKHPNMGYIDSYVFDVTYVRANGFDRQLMCHEALINLSAFYRAEAEIIFFSMIPKQFHERRSVISLPSFDTPYHENISYFSGYGINKKSFDHCKTMICSLPANKRSAEYESFINSLTKTAANAQAVRIEKTIHCRLFKAENPKLIVHDHGDSLKKEPFTL